MNWLSNVWEQENSKGPFRPERQKVVELEAVAGGHHEEVQKPVSSSPVQQAAGFKEMEENRTDTSEADETEDADTDEQAHNIVSYSVVLRTKTGIQAF